MSGSDACSLSSSYIFYLLICLVIFFLIVGHDILHKRNYYKQVCNNAVVWGKESVPSPMVRSPSFRESMPLGCKLHKCFSAFFLPLRWDQMTGADWSWTVPCPGQLSSDNASISQTLVS